MKLNPAPRFLHVIGVEFDARMVSGLYMADKPFQLMGRVVVNKSTTLSSSIAPGDIVFFRADNANSILLDEDGMNVIIFEDAILGWCAESDLKCKLRKVSASGIKVVSTSPVTGMGNAPGRA